MLQGLSYVFFKLIWQYFAFHWKWYLETFLRRKKKLNYVPSKFRAYIVIQSH